LSRYYVTCTAARTLQLASGLQWDLAFKDLRLASSLTFETWVGMHLCKWLSFFVKSPGSRIPDTLPAHIIPCWGWLILMYYAVSRHQDPFSLEKKTSDSMLWQRIVDTATRRWRSLPYHDCVQEWRNLTCCCEIRFGTSVGGRLLSALLCWPSPWVVLIGALASSIGAALQCLTSTHSTLWGRKKEPIFFCMHLFNIWQKLVNFFHILKNV